MRTIHYRHLIVHVTILIVLLASAWFNHTWIIVLGIYVLGFFIWHIRHLSALEDWLSKSKKEPPFAWGLTQEGGTWRRIFERLYQQQKRQKKSKQKLKLGLEEYRNATESFPEPIITLDDELSTVWFNAAAINDLNLRHPDDLNQPLGNILRHPEFVEWLENGSNKSLDMASPHDSNITLNVRMFKLSQRRQLLLFRDVTELRNLETVRREFVANVSHELRTPLTVLIGYLESLSEDNNPELRLITERMHDQTRSMHSLINDLIEISRLQGQTIRGPEADVDISAMLAQLKEQTESLNQKKHRLSFSMTADYNVRGAEKDLESAFSNLINNALSYTPISGHIHISWENHPEGAMFRVKDDGIGIPHEDIPRLTERFYRVAKDRARSSGGSGLGLSIVKHVLNAHDAHLDIHSELGVGSEFCCLFPKHRLIARQPSNVSQRHSA